MFSHEQRKNPFACYSVRENTVPEPEETLPDEINEMNEEAEEEVAIKPKKVKHRLPGVRLLRMMEKQRLKELKNATHENNINIGPVDSTRYGKRTRVLLRDIINAELASD